MNQPNRPGQITYYDQLGVAPDASAEEIRDSFRALARLLHPDQQTDPQLKEAAERQMRRLNLIYGALSDPERRQRYDDELEDGYPPAIIVGPPPVRDLRKFIGRGVWMAALLLSAGMLIWLASDNAVMPAFRERDEHPVAVAPANQARPLVQPMVQHMVPPLAQSPPNAARDSVRLLAELKSVAAQRDVALNELARMQGIASPPPETGGAIPASVRNEASRSVQTMTLTELPGAAKAPVSIAPRAADIVETARRLTGFWFYVKPRAGQNNKNRTLYPPEYIEATLTEENGRLYGRYRSRFQIVDRAIFPDVNFTFSGVPNGSSLTSPWIGPGGARGELTLKLMADNKLQVDWTATELGSQQGLVSGTALLTRRID